MEESTKRTPGLRRGLLRRARLWPGCSCRWSPSASRLRPRDVHSAYRRGFASRSSFRSEACWRWLLSHYRRKVEESGSGEGGRKTTAASPAPGSAPPKIFLQARLMTVLWLLLDCVTRLIPGVLAFARPASGSRSNVRTQHHVAGDHDRVSGSAVAGLLDAAKPVFQHATDGPRCGSGCPCLRPCSSRPKKHWPASDGRSGSATLPRHLLRRRHGPSSALSARSGLPPRNKPRFGARLQPGHHPGRSTRATSSAWRRAAGRTTSSFWSSSAL